MKNSIIVNISPKHFQSIILPNIQNTDYINIYLFYREANFVEKKEFEDFLSTLDLKLMLIELFEISSFEQENFIKSNTNEQENFIKSNTKKNNLIDLKQKIFEFDLEKLDNNEISKMKWLLYDCLNPSANPIVNLENSKFSNEISNGTLDVYFTDKKIYRRIKKLLNSGYNFTFYNNEKSKKYLKIFKSNNDFYKIHDYVCSNGKKYLDKKTNECVDHMQKAPQYFYDFNCLFNMITSIQLAKNDTEMMKNIIYSKIIECWRNRLNPKMHQAQFNNCSYNLKLIDGNLNKTVKQENIENSFYDWIYIHTDLNSPNTFYATFYFPESQYLNINNKSERISLLSIKYYKSDYNNIIKELSQKICNSDNIDVMISNLFEYIKGKNILYMLADEEDITKKAIITTRAFFDTDNYKNKYTEIENFE